MDQGSRVPKYQYSKNWLSARKKWQKVVFISKVYIQLDIEQIFTCRVYIGFYFCLYSTMEYQLNILFMIFKYLVNTWWILCKLLQSQSLFWYVPQNKIASSLMAEGSEFRSDAEGLGFKSHRWHILFYWCMLWSSLLGQCHLCFSASHSPSFFWG